MTSPATTIGTTSGAEHRCADCGARLTRVRALHTDGRAVTVLRHAGVCPGVTLELFRDDGAGVTLAIYGEPVGSDQLESLGAGKLLGEADAVGDRAAEHDSSIATPSSSRSVSAHAPNARGRMRAGSQGEP